MKEMYGTKNISQSNGYFRVTKRIDGSEKFIGSAKTLIQALMIRDWAEQNNWQHYPKNTVTNEKYITRAKSGTYCVGKKINGKTRYYGGFKTLEEAIVFRDKCIKHGWSSNLKKENPLAGIQKTKHGYYVYASVNGKCEYVGNYRSLEEAKEVRQLFIKYNGDWDLICEHDTGERAWLTGLKPMGTMFEKVNRGASDIFRAKHLGLLTVGRDE